MTPIVSPAAGATTTPRPTAPDVDPADRTHILCIDGLTRPFTEPGLRQMLVSEAGAVGGVVDLEVVDVWLAKLKTHAVVVFGNETQAEAVRKATYMLKWPLGTAKALLPRFVNGEDAAQIKAGGDDGAKGMSSPSAAAAEPSLSTAAVRGGFLAAIKASQQQSLTARGAGAAAAAAAAPETRLISPRGPDLGKETAVDAPAFSNKDRVPQAEEKVYSLDDLFRKTKSKPAIYYLPHTEEYVVKLNQKRSGVATERR
jgi:apoptotic chromatin condensation inducer in the nucleus